MADAPPSSTSNNQGSEGQGNKVETVTEISPPSVFVNSEPIREDQVQNAVKFLSHPKVRGSPVIHRRSFLERKGLTKEEIDEAFRRVPDETPAVTATQSPATNQDGQIVRPSSDVQQQPPTQIVQPVSKMRTLSRFHWYHALGFIGFLAVSGAGTVILFKRSIVPKMKSWIRKIALEEEVDDDEGKSLVRREGAKPSVAEEAAAAAKACAAAAADVARASQEMTMTHSEDKRYIEELVSMLNVQVQELKTMNTAILNLEGSVAMDNQHNKWISGISTRQPYLNGKVVATDSRSVRSLSPPVEISDPPRPKSYMEIMERVKRGERPSHIRPSEVSRSSSSSYAENPTNGDERGPFSSASSSAAAPVRRSWVPPQPPPMAMPEAAAAIRQPKKSGFQTEKLNDEQLLSRSVTGSEELRGVTEISETGGSGGAAEEENGSYVKTA